MNDARFLTIQRQWELPRAPLKLLVETTKALIVVHSTERVRMKCVRQPRYHGRGEPKARQEECKSVST